MWAFVTAVKTLLKIKHADGFELNDVRALRWCVQVDRGEASLESKHVDLVKFRELVVGLGPDYEKGCWPTLYKLVGS